MKTINNKVYYNVTGNLDIFNDAILQSLNIKSREIDLTKITFGENHPNVSPGELLSKASLGRRAVKFLTFRTASATWELGLNFVNTEDNKLYVLAIEIDGEVASKLIKKYSLG